MVYKRDVVLKLFEQGIGIKEAAKQAGCKKRYAEMIYQDYMKGKTGQAGQKAAKPQPEQPDEKKESSLNSENAKSSENTTESEDLELEDLKIEAKEELEAGLASEPTIQEMPMQQFPQEFPQFSGAGMAVQDPKALEDLRQQALTILRMVHQAVADGADMPMTKGLIEHHDRTFYLVMVEIIKTADHRTLFIVIGVVMFEASFLIPRIPALMEKLEKFKNKAKKLEKATPEKPAEQPKPEPEPIKGNPLEGRTFHTR